MNNNYTALGISLIFFAVLNILGYFSIIELNEKLIFAYTFIAYGLLTLLFSFHKVNRSTLFFSSSLAMFWVVLAVLNGYEILNEYNTALSSVLFIIGGGFFILFIESPKEFSFLIIALLSSAGAVVSALFIKSNIIIQFANRVTLILLDFWPVFLIIFGIIIIAGRKRV